MSRSACQSMAEIVFFSLKKQNKPKNMVDLSMENLCHMDEP